MLHGFVAMNRKAAAWLERTYPAVFAGESYFDELLNRIHLDIRERSPKVILEVGGIDRPLLQRSALYEYIGVDIEHQPTCDEKYDRFFVQSIESPVPAKADLVISITLLEHVPNNKSAMRSIYASMKDSGVMHHYVPSKWHPYSMALRLVGPKLQKILIRHLRPSAIEVTGYPAFFDFCHPSEMRKLLRDSGFKNVRVTCFYRAADYFAFFLPAYLLVAFFENMCRALNWRFFCSGFVFSAEKPAGADEGVDRQRLANAVAF